jgi:energy-coupling factor transport system substrate-specific component
MSSSRCYRKALDMDYIRSELTKNSGSQFDSKIVPLMLAMIDEGFAPVKLYGE